MLKQSCKSRLNIAKKCGNENIIDTGFMRRGKQLCKACSDWIFARHDVAYPGPDVQSISIFRL